MNNISLTKRWLFFTGVLLIASTITLSSCFFSFIRLYSKYFDVTSVTFSPKDTPAILRVGVDVRNINIFMFKFRLDSVKLSFNNTTIPLKIVKKKWHKIKLGEKRKSLVFDFIINEKKLPKGMDLEMAKKQLAMLVNSKRSMSANVNVKFSLWRYTTMVSTNKSQMIAFPLVGKMSAGK